MIIYSHGLVILCTLLSAVVFYAGCPNQQWFSKRYITFLPALFLSLLLLIPAWLLLRLDMSVLSSSFTLLTAEMLFLGTIPFLTRFKTPLKIKSGNKSSLIRGDSYNTHKAQWTLKIVGMSLLGFPFAVFTSSLLGWWAPASIPNDVRSQFIMWMIVPLWITPISLVFISNKPWRLFLGFSLFTLLAFGLLSLVNIGG